MGREGLTGSKLAAGEEAEGDPRGYGAEGRVLSAGLLEKLAPERSEGELLLTTQQMPPMSLKSPAHSPWPSYLPWGF